MSSSITLTDMFCGCGGSSEGARNVGGVEVELALNHWRRAIETHNTNHPKTKHDCADISETHPARYWRTTGLIASPECTNHTVAGGKRIKNLAQGDLFQAKELDLGAIRSRATMWDVVRFAEQHKYEFIITENVVEVRHWVLFGPWVQAMHNLGYLHECVYLNGMFAHGEGIKGFAPQSRDRIYIVFWKKGNRKPDLNIRPAAPCQRCEKRVEAIQVFKPGASDKAKYRTQYVYRCPSCTGEVVPYYYAALNCLNLGLPMVKIGEREQHGMKPLAPNTMARIRYGLKKMGLVPTILDQRNSSGSERARIRSTVNDVFNTQSTGYSSYLFAPFLFDMSHSACDHNSYVRELTRAIHTQTTQQSTGLILPPFLMANRANSTPRDLSGAMHTVCCGNHEFMILPPAAMLTMRGSRSLDPLTDPMATQVAAGIQNWLVSATPMLTAYHGGSHQSSELTNPTPTIPTNDSLALVQAQQQPDVEDCYFRMVQPEETKLAQGFPGEYIITGNKDEQQKQIGNANPPPTMELLVQRCVASLS